MPALAYTPYDGSKQPFSIGLAPLGDLPWIEVDERLPAYLKRKAALIEARPDIVWGEEDGTREAQGEVLEAIVGELMARHEDLYRRLDGGLAVPSAGLEVRFGQEAPLLSAARLVGEDLVLMRNSPSGWRLVAAALCFPSSWSLKEKFGRSMDEIHAPVPGYPAMAERMKRIFDSLRVEIPVWRLNWSIYPDDDLHHPESKQLPRGWFEATGSRAFVRVERQTLRKMPGSGDILFTIKVLVDPLEAFAGHPEGARLAAGLRSQLMALDPGQLAYKSLTHHRDALAARLESLAAG